MGYHMLAQFSRVETRRVPALHKGDSLFSSLARATLYGSSRGDSRNKKLSRSPQSRAVTPIERNQQGVGRGTIFYHAHVNKCEGGQTQPPYFLPSHSPRPLPQLKRQEIVITIWSCNHSVGAWKAAARAVCPILRRGGQWLSERVIYNLLWLATSAAANPDKCFIMVYFTFAI